MSGVTALTKSAAQALVEREERRTGSRMVAYVNVASMVGASAEWLRKFVGKCSHEAKRPDVEVGFNILVLHERYEEIVTRVDDNTRRIADENAALRKQIHAVTPRSLSQHLAADNQVSPANPSFLQQSKGEVK